MKARFLSRVVCVVGLMAVTASASCSHDDPEGFCKSWVESTCQALAGCCHTGTKFDPDECQIELSRSCQTSTDASAVEAGQVKFDSGAASTCLGTVTSCSEVETTAPETYAHGQACANMLTGYVPVGAACSGADQCEQAGDFTVCYSGSGSLGGGVCAQAVLDTTTCSFSFSTFELHICPDGTYCDSAPAKATSGEPPSQQAFEFSASCKPYISAGGDCLGTDGELLPCAAGLSCQVTGPAVSAKCTANKTVGQACGPFGECDGNLECALGPTGMETCQAVGPTYCYSPDADSGFGGAGGSGGD
jgi:hypothetical protein